MNKHLTYISIAILICIITLIGLPLNLMPPDAALYGSIAKTMHLNNDYINLYSLGKDWLDKPHLPFWLTALSFKIFGISNFAYKLPAVLTFLFGVWVTFKFTEENYNRKTAILAAIILSTSLHSVISNFDVRAEPYLTGFIIAGLYWLYKYIKTKKFKNMLLGSLFCALAVMTKGIFALIPIIAALGGHLLVHRKWKEILNPMWLIGILLITLFITPELYALYQQFDMHPEKVVFGKTNVSGIRFFLWDSQFGRFFNTGPIKGRGDVFFFLHTILWAFLPWAILFYIASFLKIKRNFKKVQPQEEFYSIFATITTLVIFSLSKFQLAHYTNIVFPFMAILTADFIVQLSTKYQKLIKTYKVSQWFLISIVFIAITLISIFLQPEFNPLFILVVIACIATIYVIQKERNKTIHKIFLYSSVSFCLLYGFMLTHFYPTLFKYQGGVNAAKYANTALSGQKIHFIDNGTHNFGFEFYLNATVKRVKKEELKNKPEAIFYANSKDLELLDTIKIRYTILNDFDFYRITKLKGKFVNHKSRPETLRKKYLIKLN